VPPRLRSLALTGGRLWHDRRRWMLVELSLTPLQPFGYLFATLLGFAMAHIAWFNWQHDFRRDHSIDLYLHRPSRR
jgi:hypothetical protein